MKIPQPLGSIKDSTEEQHPEKLQCKSFQSIKVLTANDSYESSYFGLSNNSSEFLKVCLPNTIGYQLLQQQRLLSETAMKVDYLFESLDASVENIKRLQRNSVKILQYMDMLNK
ncbi:Hypothetical_protein [Hexamita inflata]|uniref:Hypothetical_protein n=1 Tax=Hexamita inflata TaxID=28002 RepID=A0AA86PIB7_9EUKA|nr:Hypothetical protein HINF_LOCUS26457 [Hexamita inflata]CAI9964778.1 Hypothetical protein HINF_LOCUS52423 [Hexamita inflata]